MLKTLSGDLALGPWGFVPGRERGGSRSCCTLVPGPEMGAAGGRAEATLCVKLHPSRAANGLWLRCLAIAHTPPPCPKPPIVSPCHGLPQSPSGRLQWGVQLCMDQGCASHGNCGAVMCHWAHDVIRCPLEGCKSTCAFTHTLSSGQNSRGNFSPHECRLPRPCSCPEALCSMTMSMHCCLLEDAKCDLRQAEREMRRQMKLMHSEVQQLCEELPAPCLRRLAGRHCCLHQRDTCPSECWTLTSRVDVEREPAR